jgi:hypothetical protein
MKDPSEKAPDDVVGKSGFGKTEKLMHGVGRSPGVICCLMLPDQDQKSWLALAQQADLRVVKTGQVNGSHACLSGR